MTADQLRAFRLSQGLGTPAFAKVLGVEPSTIVRWENGDRAIPAPVALLLRILEELPEARAVAGLKRRPI